MPTLTKVYQADGIAAALDFSLHAGLRNHTDGFHCPDEALNCPTSMYIVCAFDAVQNLDKKVAFLKCMDASKSDDAEVKTKACAAQLALDFSKISTCFGGGHGKQLMQVQADWINSHYPLGGPQLFVPHVKIGGKTLSNMTHTPNYTEVLAAVCATGITAGACGKMLVV